jgi:hypothetical protein
MVIAASRMVVDLCGLVRRDHDDLDRALHVLVDPTTTADDLTALLDVFQLALAVHVAAEAIVVTWLLNGIVAPPALRMVVAQASYVHDAQQRAAIALAAVSPATSAWYERALELRVLVLDHTTRAELTRWTLQDHVPMILHSTLAARYATERMRVLARTSPLAIAQARASELARRACD